MPLAGGCAEVVARSALAAIALAFKDVHLER